MTSKVHRLLTSKQVMATPRDNIFKALRHEVPDWIPVAGHVDPYNQPNRKGMDPKLADALGTVQWSDESTVAFSRYLGLDVMDYHTAPIRSVRKTVPFASVQQGEDTITTCHTPLGDMRQVHRRCREDGTSYCLEHYVKGPRDLPLLARVFEEEQFELDPAVAQRISKRKAQIGDDGTLMLFMSGTPMGMMARVYSGVETLAYLWADAPDALRDLFEVMERNHLDAFRLAATSEADALVGMDDTSTTVISPRMFGEVCLAYTDHIAEAAHEAGKFYLHHSCGLIRNLLPLYRQTKMDAVHAFQIPPMGDVTIAEGKRLLGPRVTIIASLVQMCGSLADRAAVERSIRQMFEDACPGDNVILGVAADPEKTMEETAFVVASCMKYRDLALTASATK